MSDQYKELARLLTLEQGKPLKESTDEVRGFANILEFYAGISACQNGEVIRLGTAGDCIVIREPLGVCGVDYTLEYAGPYHGLENRPCAACRKHCWC